MSSHPAFLGAWTGVGLLEMLSTVCLWYIIIVIDLELCWVQLVLSIARGAWSHVLLLIVSGLDAGHLCCSPIVSIIL